ncbi:hypothetical protein N7488_002569 [Penicillium malachiteum]|nr:hypothetical protein N7488_002569 [Penicillium malachiteum]
MAPLVIRQSHSLVPSPPRPHKGEYTKPVEVTTHIDPIVFAKLFAGTVGIFILSVLIWKLGNFIRSFSQYRVLREGNSPTTRYAKTWYGWVTIKTHERNKQFFRNIFAKVSKWTAWKSTRTDYRWVWWDPGQEALKARRKNRRLLRWLPKFLMSYDSPTADEIWNPGPPVECHGALLEPQEPSRIQLSERIRELSEENANPIPRKTCRTPSREEVAILIKPQDVYGQNHSRLSICTSEDRREDIVWYDARMHILSSTISLDNDRGSLGRGKPSKSSTKRDTLSRLRSNVEKDTMHLAQLDGPGTCPVARPPASKSHHPSRDPPRGSNAIPSAILRKYQVWSAKMQVQASKALVNKLRDSSGPPGTPMVEIFSSLGSEQSVAGNAPEKQMSRACQKTGGSIEKRPLTIQQAVMRNRAHLLDKTNPGNTKTHYNTLPLRLDGRTRSSQGLEKMESSACARYHITRHTVHDVWAQDNIKAGPQDHRVVQSLGMTKSMLEFSQLNDWEVKLMDMLDRKLTWLFNETTPGQKPYHFALLANHWLNRETWLVIDPVSRVSTDARRNQGDPRYNVPYPKPDLSRKPKYPVPVRKRAHHPRIDSWRAAVNRQRRVSGIRERLQPVELYEDSAEEPPDGHIDTACWMLPRPPQGFEMSSKQRNAWYEGGAGWQEKLDDWRAVKRGYRLRRGIFDGRVNRNRVIELGRNINGHCRRVLLKSTAQPAERRSRIQSAP